VILASAMADALLDKMSRSSVESRVSAALRKTSLRLVVPPVLLILACGLCCGDSAAENGREVGRDCICAAVTPATR